MVDLFARLRSVRERGVARCLRLIHRDIQFGATADKTFAALHAHGMHGAGIQTFAGEQLEGPVLPLEVDRADFGNHHAGDLPDDLVETLLAVAGLRHDLAQAPHDHTQRRLGGHHSWLVASPLHGRAARVDPADISGAQCSTVARTGAQSASRP